MFVQFTQKIPKKTKTEENNKKNAKRNLTFGSSMKSRHDENKNIISGFPDSEDEGKPINFLSLCNITGPEIIFCLFDIVSIR